MDGFSLPEAATAPQRRAWLLGIALSCCGAFRVTCLDLTVGLMDRSSLRIVCIVGGVLLIAVAILVQYMIRQSAGSPPPAWIFLVPRWPQAGRP